MEEQILKEQLSTDLDRVIAVTEVRKELERELKELLRISSLPEASAIAVLSTTVARCIVQSSKNVGEIERIKNLFSLTLDLQIENMIKE